MNDLINRQDFLRAFEEMCSCTDYGWDERDFRSLIKRFPSAEPEIKPISYADCSNAMLKMWIDNVLTDGEYNKIMDKLNAKHRGE